MMSFYPYPTMEISPKHQLLQFQIFFSEFHGNEQDDFMPGLVPRYEVLFNDTPRRRATRYQHGNKLFTRRKRRGIHPEYPSPVPFPTGREGDGGWVH
jgi:hypothetical protein